MTTTTRRHGFATLLVFPALIAGFMVAAPRDATAFCCRPLREIRLQPVDPASRLRGRAELDDCFGVSLLRVRVYGPLPDGTQLIPVFPGLQPLIGDWITMTGRAGETIWEGLTLDTIAGRPFAVSDDTFTEVLTGQF